MCEHLDDFEKKLDPNDNTACLYLGAGTSMLPSHPDIVSVCERSYTLNIKANRLSVLVKLWQSQADAASWPFTCCMDVCVPLAGSIVDG